MSTTKTNLSKLEQGILGANPPQGQINNIVVTKTGVVYIRQQKSKRKA